MMNTPKACPVFRTGYNYDMFAASNETAIDTGTASLVQQEFKDECDINNIVSKFLRTGELPDPVAVPQYGDFTGIPDYQTALNMVIQADAAFMQLDPNVRARFDNDAGRFMDFVHDPANGDELLKLGLRIKKEPSADPPEGNSPGSVSAASPPK